MNNLTSNNQQAEVKLSGIVVTFNEADKLHRCLASLCFCDQLMVVDLGSTDGSIEIARQFTENIIYHRRVDVIEMIREWVIQFADHKWICFIDPDEVVPECLAVQLKEIAGQDSSIGMIRAPWQFFFAGKRLTTTVWGRANNNKPVLIHSERVRLDPYVHRGYQLQPGYTEVSIAPTSCNAIEHYWVDSYQEWFEKHKKYISHEGKSRHAIGLHFSWLRMAIYTLWDLKFKSLGFSRTGGRMDRR